MPHIPTLNTKLLFYQLLRSWRPATVLDIGSLDGTHAMRFKKLVPTAHVVAFEANPHNVATMQLNAELKDLGVELVPKAVGHEEGELTFHVEETSAAEPWRRGISSTRTRTSGSLGNTATTVEMVRLESFIRSRADLRPPMALWIDVEGASYEVLCGIKAVSEDVLIIHVEVEVREFWKGQHLKSDVEALMESLGFCCIGRGPMSEQHDLIYVRKSAEQVQGCGLRRHILRAQFLTFAQKILGGAFFRYLGNLYLQRTKKHG